MPHTTLEVDTDEAESSEEEEEEEDEEVERVRGGADGDDGSDDYDIEYDADGGQKPFSEGYGGSDGTNFADDNDDGDGNNANNDMGDEQGTTSEDASWLAVIWTDVKNSVIGTWVYINVLLVVTIICLTISAYVVTHGIPKAVGLSVLLTFAVFSRSVVDGVRVRTLQQEGTSNHIPLEWV
jgi:hypothetical protein